MSEIFLAVMPMICLVGVGYVLRQTLLRETGFWYGINTFVYNVSFPALLIVDVSKIRGIGSTILLVTAELFVATALIGVIAFGFGWAMKFGKPTIGSVFQGSIRFNSYIYVAASQAIFGARGVSIAAIIMAIMVVATNVASISVLNLLSGQKVRGVWSSVAVNLRNPVMVSVAAGGLLAALNVKLPFPIAEPLRQIGALSMALSLLAVGAGLNLSRAHIKLGPTVTSCALKLFGLPAAAFLALHGLGTMEMPQMSALLCASLPVAGNSYVLAAQMNSDKETMAMTISVSTIISLISIPVILFLAQSWSR